MKYIATIDDKTYEIEINEEGEIIVDGKQIVIDFQSVANQPVFSLLMNHQSYEASISPSDLGVEVLLQGRLFHVDVEDERQRRLRESSAGATLQVGEYPLKAPMPGLVIDVPVKDGQSVKKGQDLVILESMKMQNELKAPREGVINRVRVKTGDRVDQNQVLLILT
jgi:biotin carboxyl carrier protein